MHYRCVCTLHKIISRDRTAKGVNSALIAESHGHPVYTLARLLRRRALAPIHRRRRRQRQRYIESQRTEKDNVTGRAERASEIVTNRVESAVAGCASPLPPLRSGVPPKPTFPLYRSKRQSPRVPPSSRNVVSFPARRPAPHLTFRALDSGKLSFSLSRAGSLPSLSLRVMPNLLSPQSCHRSSRTTSSPSFRPFL